ncbi:MAG TPA: hypothetical protein DEB05_15255 [Firmicutes bacterium]|nr:hypothetical protein [Bacillota bacterium]HBT18302.1 hypothetical protein [Bacillota bacterium]
MNWVSLVMRMVIGFITLFLLAYIIPGLSGFTIIHLLVVSFLLAFLSTVAENVFLADNPKKKSILLFIISALTLYLYSLVLIRQRAPVITVLVSAALITAFNFVFQERIGEKPEENVKE